MTQEEKDLLLKDLCARLPYGVKVQRINSFYKWRKEIEDLSDVFLTYNSLKQFENHIEHLEIKPYLRPMSSMTEKEKEYIRNNWFFEDWADWISLIHYHYHKIDCEGSHVDWLNAHHFDYRGLIEKGLALEAPEGMYENF